MASILNTTDTSSHYEFSTTFDGFEFVVSLVWVDASSSWYISLRDYADDIVVAGVRVVSGMPLFTLYRSLGTPLGVVACVVLNENDPLESPARESFNNGTHALVYYAEGELV